MAKQRPDNFTPTGRAGTECRSYDCRELLDSQLREYQNLYELNKRINATSNLGNIFTEVIGYIRHDLQYERGVVLRYSEATGEYRTCAFDGFNDDESARAIAELVLAGEPPLTPPWSGCEYLLCEHDSMDQAALRGRLLMHEYLLYQLGPKDRPLALLAVGNSAQNAAYHRRIDTENTTLLSLGNLAALLSSRVENCLYYSDLEKALEQERLAEAKYRGIFENAAEGIVQISPDGRMVSCNPAAATLLGYASPAEILQVVTDPAHQLYVQPRQRREIFRRLRKGKTVKNYEVEFYCKDGSRRWLQVSFRPVFGDAGEMLYVDGLVLDISDRKRVELALKELNEQLEQRVAERTSELEEAYRELKNAQSRILQQEKMASIGQLAAGVAHEINNPMGFILSNLNSLGKYADKITGFMTLQKETLEDMAAGAGPEPLLEKLREEKRTLKLDFVLDDLDQLIRESLEGAERVRTIVQNLKSFSRVDETEFRVAHVNEGIENTINIVWNELKYKAELIRDYGDIPPIYCNLGQLNQVVMNLLVNAVQAIPSHGRITVSTACREETVVITVADTGSGIPTEHLGKIFEPFFTTKEVGKGTGLGLSIAYDIVKKHGGDLQVESAVGEGTTFTITLPIVAEPPTPT